MPSAGAPAFAPAHGMVDRVHGHPANMGAASEPTAASGLAKGLVFVIDIPDLPNGCFAAYGDHPHLTGRQTQNGIFPFFGDKLRAAAGRPRQLGSLTRFQFDVVHHRPQGNVNQPEAIPRLYIRIFARKDRVTYGKAYRRKNIALFAILVVEESNMSRAVGVVFDAGNLGWDILFVTFEINDAKAAFVSATPMPGCYATTIVASS